MKEEAAQHLERSRQNLAAARVLRDARLFADSVGRSYYAMFHAAKAVPREAGIERSSHGGTIAAFNENVVRAGRLDARFGKLLREAFEARGESDYASGPSDNDDDALAMITKAEDFVEACRALLASP